MEPSITRLGSTQESDLGVCASVGQRGWLHNWHFKLGTWTRYQEINRAIVQSIALNLRRINLPLMQFIISFGCRKNLSEGISGSEHLGGVAAVR
jgi:hypothetical protein